MQNINIIDKSGNSLDIELVFAFYCKKTGKNYVALDYKKNVFEKNSSYNNLDILEVTSEQSNTIYVSEIEETEWEDVKSALQFEIFSNIKK